MPRRMPSDAFDVFDGGLDAARTSEADLAALARQPMQAVLDLGHVTREAGGGVGGLGLGWGWGGVGVGLGWGWGGVGVVGERTGGFVFLELVSWLWFQRDTKLKATILGGTQIPHFQVNPRKGKESDLLLRSWSTGVQPAGSDVMAHFWGRAVEGGLGGWGVKAPDVCTDISCKHPGKARSINDLQISPLRTNKLQCVCVCDLWNAGRSVGPAAEPKIPLSVPQEPFCFPRPRDSSSLTNMTIPNQSSLRLGLVPSEIAARKAQGSQ